MYLIFLHSHQLGITGLLHPLHVSELWEEATAPS